MVLLRNVVIELRSIRSHSGLVVPIDMAYTRAGNPAQHLTTKIDNEFEILLSNNASQPSRKLTQAQFHCASTFNILCAPFCVSGQSRPRAVQSFSSVRASSKRLCVRSFVMLQTAKRLRICTTLTIMYMLPMTWCYKYAHR